MNKLIGTRIRNYRFHQKTDAAVLIAAMGLADEAELHRVEEGEQKVTAAQMLAAMKVFGTTMEDMTDPFRLEPGEARWTFRLSPDEQVPAT